MHNVVSNPSIRYAKTVLSACKRRPVLSMVLVKY